MQKIKYLLLAFNMLAVTLIMAQCPFGNGTRTDCQYGCGMYTDEDNDGYCDNSSLSTPKASKAVSAEAVAEEPATIPQASSKANVTVAKEETPAAVNADEEFISKMEEPAAIEEPSTPAPASRKYHFWLITLLTLGLYALSFTLMKVGCLPKVYHRRIWNGLLLIVGLVSCILGFILVIHFNYHFLGAGYLVFLRYHVEAGIAMTIIALFHIAWHWQYYKNIFTKIKQQN